MPRWCRNSLTEIACLALAGCATYRPLPLDERAEAAALAPPDTRRITVEAAEIRHPLLKPVSLDWGEGLTPEQLAVVAVVADPELRAVRDERRLAQSQLLAAGILPNPRLSYQRDEPSGGDTIGTVTGHSAQLAWRLNPLWERSLREQAARAHAEQVDLAVAWREWQVAQAARVAAYELTAVGDELPLARRASALAGRIARAMAEAARVGALSQAREAGARAAEASARQTELALEQARSRLVQRLDGLLGLPPDHEPPLRAGVNIPAWDRLPSEDALVAGLAERRLDLLALRKGYASQDARLRLAIREQFPPIGILVNAARDPEDVVTLGVAGLLDLPIFDRGQGRIASASATRRRLYDEYRSRLFTARADVARILTDLKADRAEIAAGEQALPALHRSAEAYRRAAATGAADLVDAAAAQEAEVREALRLARLRARRAALGVALEVAAGEVLPADVTAASAGGNGAGSAGSR